MARRRKGLSERGMLKTWWKKTTQNHMLRVGHGPPRLTLREWQQKLEEFNYQCAYCGADPPSEIKSTKRKEQWLEIEHLVPTSRGGEHRAHNVVPACPDCNKSKGSMTLAEWIVKKEQEQHG